MAQPPPVPRLLPTPFIWESSYADHVPPSGMDRLWSQGWRHFGTEFFRYSLSPGPDGGLQYIIPLRLPLQDVQLSKSQRRVLRKNADVLCRVLPAVLTEETHAMFSRHKARFRENVPETLTTFLSPTPATVPCECLAVECHVDGTAAAISFLDVGNDSVSSVYGMFEPAHASRSLGIYTMLQEIQWARDHGFQWYYPGYATLGSSAYDYKKQFRNLQGYAWQDDQWLPWDHLATAEPRLIPPSSAPEEASPSS